MSDSEEENFCFYGKALEPYDEDAVPKKRPISVEDQIATDAHGRRRFHGAFTGGFSAGFYNTVGSLEGWKPSEFKSSRSEKAHTKQSKPEDFMDDEDIGEHGIAPQTVKATSDYAGNRKRKKQVFSEGPIPGEPVLHTLISGGNETIGYLLMKNMDLKQSPKELQQIDIDGPKIYGCVMPKTYEIKRNIESENIIPNVYLDYLKSSKSNTFGLGYEGLDKSHLNLFKSTQLIVKDKDNKKLSISGQAFGVGAFENEDEDIYARDDMSQYDFELTSEKKAIIKEKCSNTIFDKFILSKLSLLPIQVFQPPVIPHSFTGKHKVKKSRFEPLIEEKVERKDMSALIRAKYIGECDENNLQSTSSNQTSKSSDSINEDSMNITKDEPKNKNKQDFTSDLLRDKFVSASIIENPHDILEEVKKTESDYGTKEMRDAAKLKMYGPLTRVIIEWQPCALLCKRFNVREPLLDDRIKKNERKKNQIIFEYQKHNEENAAMQPGLKVAAEENIAIPSSASNPPQTDDNTEKIVTKLNETPVTATLELSAKDNIDIIENTRKAPLDVTDKIDVSKNIELFKAVFLSSSESESDDESKQNEEKTRGEMMKENILNDYLVPKIKSTKEGILSHIKFNPLFRNKNTESSPQKNTENEQVKENNKDDTTPESISKVEVAKDPNIYGPVLPDKIQTSTNAYLPDITMDDEWVEKNDADKKKSHKHRKKHKKEKHRKKEHKSKHRR